jgi:hypothetical protein
VARGVFCGIAMREMHHVLSLLVDQDWEASMANILQEKLSGIGEAVCAERFDLVGVAPSTSPSSRGPVCPQIHKTFKERRFEMMVPLFRTLCRLTLCMAFIGAYSLPHKRDPQVAEKSFDSVDNSTYIHGRKIEETSKLRFLFGVPSIT